MNKYEYSILTENDLNETLDLVKKVFDEFEAPFYKKEGVENFYKFIEYDSVKNGLNDNLKIVVAKDCKKIIGMICLRENTHIALLFVDKKYHRQGIAKKLIREAKGRFHLNNEEITVNSSPYAVEFYKKVGFEIVESEQEVDGIKFTKMKLGKYKLNNARDELELVFPSEEYKDEILDFLNEHRENGIEVLNGAGGLERIPSFNDWLEKTKFYHEGRDLPDGKVQATVYMAIRKSDKRIVGMLQIRHCLNEKLASGSGHIGDCVRPTERQKGYSSEMIRLALLKCKEMKINRVLMSCDKDNIASAKSIINNGGILEREYVGEDNTMEQQYWISLKNRSAHINQDKFGNELEIEEKTITVDEEDFKGDIHLNKFISVSQKFIVPSGICIQDNGYSWLEFYDYDSRFKLTAIYDENDKIIEWYFDLVRRNGKENGLPYSEDLYLDIVLNEEGKVLILDEDEFDEAYKKFEMTEQEFISDKKLVYDKVEELKGNVEEIKRFTDKYLKILSEK